VCSDDQQAIAVITARRELSIHVPDDISVISNDDISYASMCSVPLTTVRAPQHEIGAKVAEILIRHIESPSLIPPEIEQRKRPRGQGASLVESMKLW